MTRWRAVAGDTSGEDYQRRFDALAASGASVHGEADFVDRLVGSASRILDAGCGTGRVAVELARRGHDVVGVDVDASMLAVAQRTAPDLVWRQHDLVTLASVDLGPPFDLVVLAGNVIPLLAAGTERAAVGALVARLRADGRLVAGFGLDVAHLPLDHVPVTLDDYDGWCAEHGLVLESRFGTWGAAPFDVEEGYAVSVHRRTPREAP
jgi:SAM-dependent methyltransferase